MYVHTQIANQINEGPITAKGDEGLEVNVKEEKRSRLKYMVFL
jgi:hypothetical protein